MPGIQCYLLHVGSNAVIRNCIVEAKEIFLIVF
jgi:hypothetical protein